jgi:hypothetical protein
MVGGPEENIYTHCFNEVFNNILLKKNKNKNEKHQLKKTQRSD